ncbi:MAG: hypothetical protein INQ03_11435 [Candidatus Heimdallarchaeota archaeon]|nr:hypothetical protein [Candidatus Heimdallarchaeota archaeon]
MECINCGTNSAVEDGLCESCLDELQESIRENDEITAGHIVDVSREPFSQRMSVSGDMIEDDEDLIAHKMRQGSSSGFFYAVVLIILIMMIIYQLFR